MTGLPTLHRITYEAAGDQSGVTPLTSRIEAGGEATTSLNTEIAGWNRQFRAAEHAWHLTADPFGPGIGDKDPIGQRLAARARRLLTRADVVISPGSLAQAA